MERIPTSVVAFDSIVNGGIPAGSVVLLYGEAGSGHREFAHTSAANLSLIRYNRELLKTMGINNSVVIPAKTTYISFSKSENEILREISLTFSEELFEAFKRDLVFKDFSVEYFKHTIVPREWASSSILFSNSSSKDMLKSFIEFINEHGNDSIVIIDSLTDLITSSKFNENDIIDVIKGLSKVSKRWNSIVYMILSEGIASPRFEKILFDIVDGVLVFEWGGGQRTSRRYRYMYVKKFTGVLSHIEENKISKFTTALNSKKGFVVINVEKVG